MTSYYGYPYIGLTGGGDGALDSLDGSLLKNGDFAVVVVPGTNLSYIYTLDEDSAAAESSPDVISPDSNAGDKRWVLTGTRTDANAVSFTAAGAGAVSRTTRDKNREIVSAGDYPTINEAIEAVYAAGGGTVEVYPGVANNAITSSIVMKNGVDLVGKGSGVVITATGCHGITYDYTTGYGNSRISNLWLQGSGATDKIGIYQAGTLDDADELYGVTVDNALITDFNVGIQFRTVRNVTINNCWIQDVNSGIYLIGKCLVVNITHCKIVKAAGCGSGTERGIYAEWFDYTEGSGNVRPESIRVAHNHVYGFTNGIDLEASVYATVFDNDVQATGNGVTFEDTSGILNIIGNYIEIAGASGANGIYGKDQSVAIDSQINITKNRLLASSTTAGTSIGVLVGTSATGNCDNVNIGKNTFIGFTLFDIAVYKSGHITIEKNSCYSTGTTNSILTSEIPANRPVHIDKNDCYKTIGYDSADYTGGDIQIGTNVISQTTLNFGQPGTWTTPTFSAGDYTANGSMTWTVAEGDVTSFAYVIQGKVMTVVFTLATTTVGGTPNTQLHIAIPASKTATKRVINPVLISDNGTQVIGWADVAASGTKINIQLLAGANFAASTNATLVYGQITFEIN